MGKSIWQGVTTPKQYDRLNNDLETDVCIIGGGLTGTLTANLLAEHGYQTILLEANTLGVNASGNNTGKATIQHGPIYHQIANKYNLEYARAYKDFNTSGQDYILSICKNAGLDIDERPSWLFSQTEKEHITLLEEERVCRVLQMDCHSRSDIPLSIKVTSALELKGQYQVNPLQIVYQAAEESSSNGCQIFEHSRVIDIKKGTKIKITTIDGYTVEANKLIIATKYPCYGKGHLLIPRLEPERSYIVVSEIPEPFEIGMFINVGKPVLSITGYTHKDTNYLLVGGYGHRVGKNHIDSYGTLKAKANKIFGVKDFCYQYSAQDLSTHDSMPFVGKLIGTPNIYIASGYNKWGITTSAACAVALDGLIRKGGYPQEKYFTTKRKGDIFSKNFLTSNAETASEFIKSKFSDTEKSYPAKGEAKIMKIDGKRCGVYRDNQNKLWAVEMKCSHLGCGMNFNEAERSWDCPCHGSRYGYDGRVLEGPAIRPLNQMPVE